VSLGDLSRDIVLTLIRDNHIYVAGPLKVQNRLMIWFLELETGATCSALTSIRMIPVATQANESPPNLALWDCFGKSREAFLSEIDADVSKIMAQHYVALINVFPGLGIGEESVARGARGYFHLEEGLDELKKGIDAILNGEFRRPKKMKSGDIVEDARPDPYSERTHHFLTNREVEILRMLAEGYSNSEIADAFCINLSTVKSHLYKAYKKIDVPSRLKAALWFRNTHSH
jgi:DNA-binding NarL/FixJ family response regulator